jgi:hypothetical protein
MADGEAAEAGEAGQCTFHEALDDRASFRRFCGFAAHEPTPERTAFVRFRRELVRRGLDRALFEEVPRQLKAKAVTVKTGTQIDATLIASASHADGEAAWAGHQRRRAIHGFKAHVGADADTALVEEAATRRSSEFADSWNAKLAPKTARLPTWKRRLIPALPRPHGVVQAFRRTARASIRTL